MEPLLEELLGPVRAEVEEMSRLFERELSAPSAVLRDLVAQVSRYKGKRLRGAEVLLVGKALGPLDPEHLPVAAIVEMIHTATLVHDDVLDQASKRRGLASVNARFGNPTAVLLGDYLYAKAFHLSTGLRSQVASRLLAGTTRTVCRGEIEQTAARFDFDLTEERYVELIDMKTASLHGAACELGCRYAGQTEELACAMREFGRSLGLAFQIVDDCLDLDGEEAVVGKSLGTDVAEGKVTLPVVHLLARLSPRERVRVKEIYLSEGIADRAGTLAAEFDLRPGIEYALGRADGSIRKAQELLDRLPASPSRDALASLAEYVLCRRS
ncbi:MAG TPA: polyprenyl synthetase family protein [Planctomycetota bacterium]|nr:polyprenyl synthetase family protein [Planctomycetota bacterium]